MHAAPNSNQESFQINYYIPEKSTFESQLENRSGVKDYFQVNNDKLNDRISLALVWYYL